MVIILINFFILLSFAQSSDSCVDDIPQFLEVTHLDYITCELAYNELHQRCEQRIPTAPSYKLVDFCCAYCAGINTAVTTDPPTLEPTTTTETSTETTTTTKDPTSSTAADVTTKDPSYEPSYGPSYAPSTSAYDAAATTTDSDNDNNVVLAVTITTVLGVLFLVGWVILYFQLDKRGYWTKGLVMREKVPSEASSDEENSSESESYSSNDSLYNARGHSTHSHLLRHQQFPPGVHRPFHSMPIFPGFQPPPPGMPPIPGFPIGPHPLVHGGPMGPEFGAFLPPKRSPNHRPTNSFSVGPFTNDDDDNSETKTTTHTHSSLTTHSTSTTTSEAQTTNSENPSPNSKVPTPHTRQESIDPIKIVNEMQRELDRTLTEDQHVLKAHQEDSEEIVDKDGFKKDEIHIIIETSNDGKDVHIL